jgi:superfamily II DNA or RNA helicase
MAQAIAATYRQTLCVVHTRALLQQATRRLGRTHTIQQLLRSGLPVGAPMPKLVVWDECHHSAADEWVKLAAMFPGARLLGLTATPQRADGRGLELFDEMVVATQYSYLVKRGVIVKPRVFVPEKKVDGSDPDPVVAYRQYADGSRVLFFLRDIPAADAVTERLGPGFAAWHSGVPWGKRARAMKAFRNGELRGLVTCNALTEGFDVPSVETIVLGRPCEHVGTYIQIVGRGLRASPGKGAAVVLDLCGASLQHGSPIADRRYMLGGTGIAEGGQSTPHEVEREHSELGQHVARLIEVVDWAAVDDGQKRRHEARLKALAKRRGYPEAAADEAARVLFG